MFAKLFPPRRVDRATVMLMIIWRPKTVSGKRMLATKQQKKFSPIFQNCRQNIVTP